MLLFAFGRPDVPVDTHVYRVGGRLGLWPQKASFDRAHDELLRLCGDDGNFAYAAAWAYQGEGKAPVLHKEPLQFEYVKLAQRSYK